MSPGERMVWAAEFVRALQEDYGLTTCVRVSCDAGRRAPLSTHKLAVGTAQIRRRS